MLREKQAASFLGVAPKTLANWRSQGKGPRFCRLGRTIAYRQEDLDAFAVSNLVNVASAGDVRTAAVRGGSAASRPPTRREPRNGED